MSHVPIRISFRDFETMAVVQPPGEANLELDNEEFDPTTFVARLRDYEDTIPLENIQEQLRNKLALLKKQLYELINQDYPEFMSLANGLQGIEEHTHSLRSPLLEIAKSTEALMLGARSSREKMESAVVKRSELDRRKRALERGLKFTDTLKEAELLIGIGNHETDDLAPFLSPIKAVRSSKMEVNEESDIDESDEEVEDINLKKRQDEEDECIKLERATHCCLQLLADLRSSEIAEIPKLHLLTDRAKQLQHEVLTRLTNVFVSEVTPPDQFSYSKGNKHKVTENKLIPCLRALAAMQRGQELERAYGDLVLRPFIHATFTKVKLDYGGSRGSCKGLNKLYENTINYIKAACGDTLRINEQIFINQQKMSIDLLCNGVWATLVSALLSKFGDDLFVSGLPQLFHANYSSTFNFLRQLEDCALTLTNHSEGKEDTSRRMQIRQRIESHPSTLELWKKWNLPVYFQLRAQEVKTSIDDALKNANQDAFSYLLSTSQDKNQGDVTNSSSSPSFSLILSSESSEILLKRPLYVEEKYEPCMKTCKEVGTIKDRELNLLVMQQFHDAIAFCWRSQDVFLRPLAHKFLKLTLQAFAKFQAWLTSLCSEEIKVMTSNASTSTNQSFQWKLSTEELVLISCDVRRLSYWINHHVAPCAEKLINQDSQVGGSGLITECLLESSQEMSSLSTKCWYEIANQISSLCCEKLEAVKSIAGSFRMTNKATPKTCSLFLPSILAPLKDFDDVFGSKAFDIEEDDGISMKDEVEKKEDWRVVAVNKISRCYCDIVSDVLNTARSMDDALRKRKKNNKASDQGLSDADKIGLQLYLDAHEFSNELVKMKLNSEKFEALTELIAQVEVYSKFVVS